jgi:hypothetical protein
MVASRKYILDVLKWLLLFESLPKGLQTLAQSLTFRKVNSNIHTV